MATFRHLINGGSKQTGSSVIFVKFNKRGEGGGKGVNQNKGGGGGGWNFKTSLNMGNE